jgi:hypothetical protein
VNGLHFPLIVLSFPAAHYYNAICKHKGTKKAKIQEKQTSKTMKLNGWFVLGFKIAFFLFC